MSRAMRTCVGLVVLAALVAVLVNAALSALAVDHDAAVIALLTAATLAAARLAMAVLDTGEAAGWTVHRSDAQPQAGEDTRTTMYRHSIEAHLYSQEPDDAIVWQLADMAGRRLRQLHGLRPDDSPARNVELLGPQLAEWVSHDRRHRYVPGERRRRYTVTQLGEAVRRIEEL